MVDTAKPDRFTLSRWSRRKLESAREKADAAPEVPHVATVPGVATQAVATDAASPADSAAANVPELPPVESLTIDSDFAAFLKPEVDDSTRRKALRKLFSDPRFNVMDGLDVYIDDYSKTTPIPEDLVGKLAHARHLLDPPRTRVNAQGFAEDVPEQESPKAAGTEDDDVAARNDRAGEAKAGAGTPVSAAAGPAAPPPSAASDPAEPPEAQQPLPGLPRRRRKSAEPAR